MESMGEIRNFYAGKTVFLTGATGFLGKMVLEKLLRVCPDIRKIYILLRAKKSKEPAKRFEEIFSEIIFDKLKEERPEYRDKVSAITGDIGLPDLGMQDSGKEILLKEVDVILHVAATVKFDENLKIAANINVRGVRDLVRLAKQMPQLKSFLYVSTAYSNCVRHDIDEIFYDPPLNANELIAIVESLDEKLVGDITPHLLGEFPNTYVFTKCVAENVIKTEGRGLPIAVFRPSIVSGSYNEPVPGWIDNLYGVTGILVGAAVGLIRILNCKRDNRADIVPADYVVNGAIAASWEVQTRFKKQTDESLKSIRIEEAIPIYNYVSSPQKPIKWCHIMDLAYKHCMEIPSTLVMYHYMLFLTNSVFCLNLGKIFLHYLPAYIVDFIATCIGKKPMLVKGYEKIHKFSNVIAYFGVRQWDFHNMNTQMLWRDLGSEDRKLFQFNMGDFVWDEYFVNYTIGCRKYILKDTDLGTIPQGRRKINILRVIHYLLMSLLTYGLYLLIRLCLRLVL